MVGLKQYALPIAFYILTIFTMINCDCSSKLYLNHEEWICPSKYLNTMEMIKNQEGASDLHNLFSCTNVNFTEELLSSSHDFYSNDYAEFVEVTDSIISTFEFFENACVLKLSNVTMNISNTHKLNAKYLNSLSIRLSNLTTFDLMPIPSLDILDLSDNALTSLNKTNFRNFKLSTLNVSSNRLSNIYCQNVTFEIDLSNNDLDTINCKFATTLKHLYLNNNNLSNISIDAFKDMHNLLILNLGFNQLNEVTNIFYDLENLIYLNLSNNNIYLIRFGCFVNLKALKFLDLSYNEIVSLPQGVFNVLHKLEVLDLSYNDILVLNVPNMYLMPFLNDLYLEGNVLQDLDIKSILHLKKISFTFADISCHKLKEYVDILENLQIEVKSGTNIYSDNVKGITCNAKNTTDLYLASLELSLNSLKKVHVTLTIIAICFLVIMLMFVVIQYCRYKM